MEERSCLPVILELIKAKGYQSVAFTGMAKNVGKTTSFNYLLSQCAREKLAVGLASIGRDGEKVDGITGAAKPSIWAPEGTVVAAAKEAIINSTAGLEIIEDTGFSGAMGQIYLARVRRGGEIEVATTPSSQKMRIIISMMKQLGASLVLVDGALDRTSSAAPDVSDCTILATGAAVHRQLEVVVDKTAARAEQFSISGVPSLAGLIPKEARQKIANGSASLAVGEEGEVAMMDKKSLGYEENLLELLKGNRKIKAVYINGAVVEGLLQFFINNRKILQETVLLVRSGVNILVNHRIWGHYLKAHGLIYGLNPVNLIGVICNPTSIRGDGFFPEELVDKLATKVPGIITADVISGIFRQARRE
jgi:hypothetical protein